VPIFYIIFSRYRHRFNNPIKSGGHIIRRVYRCSIHRPIDFFVANDIIRLNDPWDIKQTRTIFQGILLFASETSTYQRCSSLISSRSPPNFYRVLVERRDYPVISRECNREFNLRKQMAMQTIQSSIGWLCILFILLFNISLHL